MKPLHFPGIQTAIKKPPVAFLIGIVIGAALNKWWVWGWQNDFDLYTRRIAAPEHGKGSYYLYQSPKVLVYGNRMHPFIRKIRWRYIRWKYREARVYSTCS